MTGPLLIVGDALLDRDVVGDVARLAPDAPVPVLDETTVLARPGGAGLAALLAAADGREVTLVTALADDTTGRELAAALARAGVDDVVDLGLDGATPEKIRMSADGRPLLRLDRGDRHGAVGALTAAARAAIGWAQAVLVSDYGRGVAAEAGMRAALEELAARVPVVWDPHPRGAPPVPGCALVTPNAAEAGELAWHPTALAELWDAAAVCVTHGRRGVVLSAGRESLAIPAEPMNADPCGAGDRFASAVAGALADGMGTEEAVRYAVAVASSFVAQGGGTRTFRASGPTRWAERGPRQDPVAFVRAAGGVVVATGGCFDLLHAGHVRTLQAARALGDCLVVCLNSDDSVRRLKGPERPLVHQEDRAAVLLALGCVDAVMTFDEDTPEALLERLRPDIWAKGGDYAAEELPERAVVERGGGRTVVLPYLPGRSTSRLIEEATFHAAG